ncbi:MAG TPA: bifunctional [glutamine synthetase] adenylyltransferase/[glutamine synthetase]-adenylyl-L-tyrosine phosphorylase [Acetobacteraceae bacterium]|nr:bifunctional [glutamine synthetase] adenylyltransferase/[glutamine synthetase]-adenylyl-L-tyrosine phosphorylase [Acetobacteraceae bacterium]
MADTAFQLPARWPAPHDAGAAERLAERFAAIGRAEARLAAVPEFAGLLAAVGGNSPFLADLAVREAASLRTLAASGPDAVVAATMDELSRVTPDTRRDRVAAAMRRAKRIVALVTAVADIGGIWTLERITGALSDLAEATLSLAMAHLLRAAHEAGELRLPDPSDPAHGGGFTVLGMGKLGARELNYSSDVDLVLLYDPAAAIYTEASEGHALGGFTSRIARGLVSLMEARDPEGYVFRTDLRLRPDPAVTPPAVALPAAITYYESMGQNWERAAMIKARPVAGDLALGATFLEAIRPFVWRRGLDFAAVADIHAMKRRIDQHKGGALANSADPVARIAGHNVKLGEGGIREIEFLAQTLQLVWGGRDPTLRVPTTLGALRALVRAGHVPSHPGRELSTAYRYLRRVEHRLQMVGDRQLHELPQRVAEIERFATFMGYPDAAGFAADLLYRLDQVRSRYAEVFELVPELLAPAEARMELDFSGVDAAPAPTERALRALGFANIERIVAAVRGWQTGHVRALRSDRARELLGQLLPLVLAALARQPQPDTVFNRFDAFLARQPAGVQLLSLFQRNPGLLDRIAAVLGAAPSLANHLASHPAALDGLLSPEEMPDPVRLLRSQLRDARQLEDVIAITRRTVREEDFSVSVATMEARIDADEAGLRRSAIADAALGALLPPVLSDFSSRFGRVRGGSMAVVAMGKAGGREMMAGSDLDLMLIYDHPADVTESRGARQVPASQWFVRAAHAYVAAVTAPGADGPLYEVDMRLRPSGNKGPVAVSLASFRRYHAESAWTWERMALTRARVVAGPQPFRRRIEGAIAEALGQAGDPDRIRADAAAMRVRMLRDLPPDGPWDVKLCAGGQIEVEFVAQVLQLVHAREAASLCSPTTRIALARLAEAGQLPEAEAKLLVHADHVWRSVQGMLRITVGRGAGEVLPDASVQPLLRAVGAVDLDALRVTLDDLARQVRAIFVRHIGEIRI